MKNQCIKKIW